MRVLREDFDLLDGPFAISSRLRVISFEVPAAGPEIGLWFDGWASAPALRAVLEQRGLSVLAIAERSP